MSPIERLRDKLAGRFPGLKTRLNAPDDRDEDRLWFLDVPREGASTIEVEWSSWIEFVVVFGAGEVEVYPDVDPTFNRIAELIASRGDTP